MIVVIFCFFSVSVRVFDWKFLGVGLFFVDFVFFVVMLLVYVWCEVRSVCKGGGYDWGFFEFYIGDWGI